MEINSVDNCGFAVFPKKFIEDAWVNVMDRHEFLNAIVNSAEVNKETVVANHNFHSLYLYNKYSVMRKFYSLARYIHVDGMPLVTLFNVFGKGPRGKMTRKHRHTSPDWIFDLFRMAKDRGHSILVIGGKPGVLAKYLELSRSVINGINIHGFDGYKCHNPAVVSEITYYIKMCNPRYLLLGMGMPLQESWYIENREQLSLQGVVMNLGAFMDYWTGEKSMPPRWLAHCGFEWLWRFCSEPRRLAKRYMYEPFVVLGEILVKRIGYIKNG